MSNEKRSTRTPRRGARTILDAPARTRVRLTAKGLDRVLGGTVGMEFDVKDFTAGVRGPVAHVIDTRYPDHQVWSIARDGYEHVSGPAIPALYPTFIVYVTRGLDEVLQLDAAKDMYECREIALDYGRKREVRIVAPLNVLVRMLDDCESRGWGSGWDQPMHYVPVARANAKRFREQLEQQLGQKLPSNAVDVLKTFGR